MSNRQAAPPTQNHPSAPNGRRVREDDGIAAPAEILAAPPPVPALVDLTTAGVADLRQLPGVGPVLAERIVHYRDTVRPFSKPDDLLSVPGIGKALFAGFADRLTVSAAQAPIAVAMEAAPAVAEPLPAAPVEVLAAPVSAVEAETPAMPMAEAPPAGPAVPLETTVPPAPAEPAVTPSAPHPEAGRPAPRLAPMPARRPAPFSLEPARDWPGLLVTGLASTVLGALLTLLVIAILNRGTLLLNEKAEVAALTGQVNQLSGDVAALRDQTQALRSDVDSLQVLPGRVEAVEGSVKDMTAALKSMDTQVADLNRRTEQLEGQVQTLVGAVGRFNRFLDGLRDLLLDSQVAPSPSPAVTPTRVPAATPTPAG